MKCLPQLRIIACFVERTTGSVSLIFASVVLVLFALVGAAVDYTRWSNATGRTSDALDSALLNAARAMQTSQSVDDAVAVANASFMSNAQSRLKISNPAIKVAVASDGTSLEGTATGLIKTPFMGLLRFSALKVSASSKVAFSTGAASRNGGSDLEISLMLDVTGSMCNDGNGPCSSGTKIDGLKSAATDLVNVVLKNASTGSGVRVALVPFATYVRVGQSQDSQTESLIRKVTNLNSVWTGWQKYCSSGSSTPPSTSESYGTWQCNAEAVEFVNNWHIIPCLTERDGPAQLTDDAPGSDRWLNSASGSRFPQSYDSSNNAIATTEDGHSAASAAYVGNYSNDGGCYEVAPQNAVVPLTSDKQALLDHIHDLTAYGATAGGLGTAWTWYTLSPNWASIWPATSAPGHYASMVASGSNPPKLRKIAVLMTDGVYNAYRGGKDQDPIQISDGAKQLCANMKAQGIEIFSIGFDLDSLSSADKARATETLQSCGSDIKHFYEAVDSEQLKQSFRDIAMQLAQIYIAR